MAERVDWTSYVDKHKQTEADIKVPCFKKHNHKYVTVNVDQATYMLRHGDSALNKVAPK